MTDRGAIEPTKCVDTAYCADCDEDLSCVRERLHKGFHMTERTHRWDEYAEVWHV